MKLQALLKVANTVGGTDNTVKNITLLAVGVAMLILSAFIMMVLVIFPAVEDSPDNPMITAYKDLSAETGVDWAELVVFDMIRYDNDFSKANPDDTIFEFIEKVTFKEYKKVDDEYEVKNQGSLYGKNQIINKIEGITGKNYESSLEVFKDIKSLDEGKLWDFNIKYKSLEDVMKDNGFEEEINRAKALIESGAIYQILFDQEGVILDGDIPDHIDVVTDSQFVWPTPDLQQVSSPYGTRTDPKTGKTAYHTGVDLNAPGDSDMGKPIIASADGKVFAVDNGDGACGKNVRIQHADGFQTRYCHTQVILVSVGTEVKQGDVIALVGDTGRITGPHLHMEMKKNGSLIDPLPYIISTRP